MVELGRVDESVHITLECTLGGDLDVLVSPLPVGGDTEDTSYKERLSASSKRKECIVAC